MEGGFGRLEYIQEEEGEEVDSEQGRSEECNVSDEDGLSVPKHACNQDRDSGRSHPSTPRTVRVSFDSFDDDGDDDNEKAVPSHEVGRHGCLVEGSRSKLDSLHHFKQDQPMSYEEPRPSIVPERHDASFRFVSKARFLCRMDIPYRTLDRDDKLGASRREDDERSISARPSLVKITSWKNRRSTTTSQDKKKEGVSRREDDERSKSARPSLVKITSWKNRRSTTPSSDKKKDNVKRRPEDSTNWPFMVVFGIRTKRPLAGSFAGAIRKQPHHQH